MDKNIYSFNVKTIDGKEQSLEEYKDNVLLIVNTASKCGFTSQYTDLQELYLNFKNKGFKVLAFPANNFLNQEPGTNDEIKLFCTVNYAVTFPMFSKISVAGKSIHPLYKFLTSSETNPKFSGRITWNFNKFLVGKNGNVLARFGSRVKPINPKVISAIEEAIKL